nr:site-specific integrase [Caulobacter sp. UNC279MFTsu5.1]
MIPLDLQGHYGRREITKALGTADPARARTLLVVEWARQDREFAETRAAIEADKFPAKTPSVDVQQISPTVIGPAKIDRQAGRSSTKAAGRPSPQRPSAAVKAPKQRDSLSSVVDRWAAENKPEDRTVRRTRNIVERFEVACGPLPVQEIARQQVVQFKDALVSEGQTAANINVMIPMLGTVLNYAANKLDLIATNPAANIRVADNRRKREIRRAFTEAELETIFSSPVYADRLRPAAGGGEAAYWLPLLGLYTGARLTELGQLHPSDIVEEGYSLSDGKQKRAWVIRIVEDEARGQSVKNEGSERRIPIHADLVTLGFLPFVKSAQAAKQARLFPAITPNAQGELMGNWSKWFGRYRRKIGLRGTETVFHSFRHTFKHYARLAAIPNDVHNELTGHETGDVADNYGGLSYPLAPLVDAIERYRIPGFKLPAPFVALHKSKNR